MPSMSNINIWLLNVNGNQSPTCSSTDLAGITSNDDVNYDSATQSESDSDSSSQNALTKGSAEWPLFPASQKSQRTRNPIREIVDPIIADAAAKKHRDDGKELISLALGDPTAHGNFRPCPTIVDAIKESVDSSLGYVNACGTSAARNAIATHHSFSSPEVNVRVDPETDVIVANGCSGALELAICALLDPNSILLVPSPGFPLYNVIAESHGAKVAYYDLDPKRSWECNLDHMEQLITMHGGASLPSKPQDRKVRGIVINNPCNPTGSVFSRRHLADVLALADKYHLPIIADEVYGDLAYDESEFIPMAQVAATMGSRVPIITASGLAKLYLVPGWRVGWLVFNDNSSNSLKEVKSGVRRLAQVVLGASHIAQCAIPAALAPTKPADIARVAEWRRETKETFATQAFLAYTKLRSCPGLDARKPKGAMYIMVEIDCSRYDDAIDNDVSFTKLLLVEENVLVLPGKAFGASIDLFRVCFGAPQNILEDAFDRISSFCERHCVV